jgi:hypothetical protein
MAQLDGAMAGDVNLALQQIAAVTSGRTNIRSEEEEPP